MALLSETFEGTPGGMNLAIPQQELADTEARYIQDGLVDFPGITRRRGPVAAVGGIATFAKKGLGISSALNPLGQLVIGVLNGDAATGNFSAMSTDFVSKVDLAWPFFLPTAPPSTPYYLTDTKPSINGGAWIGVSSAYDANAPTQGLAFWRGGNNANYTTGTLTVARGSATVTGSGTSWASTASSGMFLFANTDDPYTNAYIGTVQSVNSNTSITLGAVSPFASTAKTYTLQSLRGFCPRVVKGRITSDTASAVITGAVTKFIDQALNVGTWQVYRASDFAFIGKVSTVTNNISLTLTANAAIATNNERFIAIRVDGDFNIINTANVNKVGFLNATYANRQWFANLGAQFEKTSRVWFSDPVDPEAVDLSTFDGDFIPVTSTTEMNLPIKAIMPAYNALLVFKENETFAVYGGSPTTFQVKKIEDDGIITGMAVQPYGGGVIWAGLDGIHYYDGVETTNLVVAKLGDYYKSSIRTFDPTKYRAYSMVARDHYFLFIESIAPTIPVIKGNTSATPTSYTIVINMVTRAVTILTNVNMRGSLTLPADSGQRTWYLANNSSKAVICNSNDLFDTSSPDGFVCDNKGLIATTTVTIASPAVFTSTGHGLVLNDPVYFSTTGALPTGLLPDTPYYVIAAGLTANAFEVSTSVGGSAVNTTGTQSGTHSLYRWVPGPDFYFESKKFDAGDSLRRKMFKEVKIHYLVQGDTLKVDQVLGLNNVGSVNTTVLDKSGITWDQLGATVTTWNALSAQYVTWDNIVLSVFIPKRVKFLKRSTHLSFRVYQNSAAVSRAILGPYQMSYKLQRLERV